MSKTRFHFAMEKFELSESFLWNNRVSTSFHRVFGSQTATGIFGYQVKKGSAFKNARSSPSLGLFTSFLHFPSSTWWSSWWLTQGRDDVKPLSSQLHGKRRINMSSLQNDWFHGSTLSSGSSWPTLLSPLQGDLVSMARALPATMATGRLCVCGVG